MITVQNIFLIILDAVRYDFFMKSQIPKVFSSSYKFPCWATGTNTHECMPMILTGRYWNKIPKDWRIKNLMVEIHCKTFFDFFSEHGYKTDYIVLDTQDPLLYQNIHSLFFPTFPQKGTLSEFFRGKNKLALVLHLRDTHSPYSHPSIKTDPEMTKEIIRLFKEKELRKIESLYSYGIRHVTEKKLIPFKNLLKKLDLEKTSLTIITSDHGEILYEDKRKWFGKDERRFGRHAGPKHSLLSKIPLLFYHPNLEEKIFNEIIPQIDLLPTILEIFKIPHSGINGKPITHLRGIFYR